MLINNLSDHVNAVLNTACSFVKQVLDSHPELSEMAKKKDLKSLQQWLEVNFSKQEKLHYVVKTLFNDESLNQIYEQVCDSVDIDFNKVKKAIAHLALHRRLTRETFFNLMKDYFNTPDELCKFFKGMEETEFVEMQGTMYVVPERFTLTQDQENYLDLFQSNPPMVYFPKKVKGTRNGYLNLNRGIFTKKATKHKDVPRDFLDLQNRIPYQINYILWDQWLKYHPEIPQREPEDDDGSYDKKVGEALRLHFKKAFTIELYRRLGIQTIYILTQYDYRGRNYAISYLFNPQGTDADKALLSFNSLPITEEGIYWLKISIANCFNCIYQGKSLDKHTFEIREQWFELNLESLFQLKPSEFFEKLNKLALEAESPACFWSQMHNLYYIKEAQLYGKTPKCWVITHWDATASGYQLQSIFAKDWDMARLTNVVPNKSHERKDLYTDLYNQLIAMGIPQKYSRNEIKKKCFVPAVYNSINSIKECFDKEEEIDIFYKVMSKFSMWRLNRGFPGLWNPSWLEYSFTLPDGFKAYKKMISIHSEVIDYEGNEVALHFKENIPQERSLELGPNMTHACDGLVARELARRMNWNPKWKVWIYLLRQNKDLWTYEEDASRKLMEELIALGKRFNFWSVRILKEITSSNIDLIPEEIFTRLYNELPETPTSVSEIHDSFGVHPNKAVELMKQYRLILKDLSQSRYLEEVIGELLGQEPGYFESEVDTKFVEAIQNSEYALC